MRRIFLLCVAFALIGFVFTKPRARLVPLHFLGNGLVRIGQGPELDLEQLRAQIRVLKRQSRRPDISLKLDKTIKYADVAGVLKVFQEEEYGPHFGFMGLQRPD